MQRDAWLGVVLCVSALLACKSNQSSSGSNPAPASPSSSAAPSADPDDFSGVFTLGGAKTGSMTVTRYRGDQYRLVRTDGGDEKTGVGFRVGRALFLAWSHKGAGLHVFTKNGSEQKGEVFGSQEMKLGTEHLSGTAAADLTGKFKLDAEYPPGEKYKGQLQILLKDGIYHATYYTVTSDGDEFSYTGYGLKEGDAVAVGTHSGEMFEYGAYQASADRKTFTGKILESDKISKGAANETLTFKALP